MSIQQQLPPWLSGRYMHVGSASYFCDPAKNNHNGKLYFPGGEIGSEILAHVIPGIYAFVQEGLKPSLGMFG